MTGSLESLFGSMIRRISTSSTLHDLHEPLLSCIDLFAQEEEQRMRGARHWSSTVLDRESIRSLGSVTQPCGFPPASSP